MSAFLTANDEASFEKNTKLYADVCHRMARLFRDALYGFLALSYQAQNRPAKGIREGLSDLGQLFSQCVVFIVDLQFAATKR